MYKLISSLIILTITIICLISADVGYETLAQCQANCVKSHNCEKTECLWYYAYFCNRETITCDDGNVCTEDKCNMTTGQCSNIEKPCANSDPCKETYCHQALGCIYLQKDCDVVVPCNVTSDCNRGLRCETYKCISGRCDYDNVPCPRELPCSEGSGKCYMF